VEVFRRNTMERDELLAQQSEAAERLEGQVATRTAELAHSVEELRALGEVSQAVNSSLDLDRVLDTIVARATQLSSTEAGAIYVFDETAQEFRLHATCGMDATIVTEIKDTRIRLGETAIGEAALQRKPLQIPDVRSDPASLVLDVIVRAGFRALLIVPLIGSDRIVGALVVRRRQPGSFPDRTVELLETFATQSVLAIQNARLFEALEVRTRELQEALDHQTATSEVLNVISRSPAELQPVLDVIIETAVRLCEADSGTIARLRDGQFFRSGQFGFSHEFADLMTRAPVEMTRGTITGRTLLEGKVVHILDAAKDPEYTWAEALRLASIRTGLGVPLMRDGVPIGVIALTRRIVRAFTDKQIELVTTFADQAVIAIENVRLFEEVQSRTAELARSVSELRALGEVSQAVNSTLDTKTVLETIVAKAVQLSDTNAGTLYVYSKSADRFRLRATYGMSTELITALSGQTIALDDAGIGDAARQRQPVQIADLSESTPSPAQKILLNAGFRSVLVVPLLRQRSIVGALVVRRRRPGIFSDSVVRLLETFAAQSVLAIQNARLFSELEERGRQLEIASRHKSQFLANMSHELRTPLNSVLGFTEMLVDGLYGELPDKAKFTLNRVQANGRHLLGLINDVLDLSKIEAGQLTLAIDDYSIGQIVKTVAATTEPLARAKGLELTVTIANGLPLGRGDERRLSQVLINLMGNAVKFTEHGSIQIAAKDLNGFFEVLVRDTGPGIAPEHQSRIFEEFQQVDESSTRQKGGTGLGLAISKRIIELHGGSIELDSTLGQGSTFRVTVPIRADERIAAA
jgi:signal transduction histidine kinase